ncbi:hypothetical protein Q7689_16510 [Nocardiopsis tropica]|uniref:hypothetical protein n=1 Tax=Nocardiopsis tropica TaxID=109330 RepID=UPI002E84544C|nr:hypothetical protein [Nocardiopsis tropica]
MPYSKEHAFGEITVVFSTGETTSPGSDYYCLTGKIHKHLITTWLKSTNSATEAVKSAESWRKIEDSSNDYRGTPPAGYRIFSDVADNDDVSKDQVACVKEKINGVAYAVLGEKYYEYYGMYGAAALRTKRPTQIIEKNSVMVAPDPGFWSCGKWQNKDIGEDPGDVYVLNLPATATKGGNLVRPEIKDPDNIPSEQNPVIDRETVVPCVAVKDKTRSASWIVQNSPTYTLRRRRSYSFVASLDLRGAKEGGKITKTVGWGISKTKTDAYTESVGVTVGFEAGVEVKGVGIKVTGSATKTLGYEQSFSNTEMYEQSVTVEGGAPAGYVTAMYVEKHVIYAVRNDSEHSFCSDDDRNPVAFNAGLRYTVVDNSPKSRSEMDSRADEEAIRSVSHGTGLAEVPDPDQLTGEHAPEGAPPVRVPQPSTEEVVSPQPRSVH